MIFLIAKAKIIMELFFLVLLSGSTLNLNKDELRLCSMVLEAPHYDNLVFVFSNFVPNQ